MAAHVVHRPAKDAAGTGAGGGNTEPKGGGDGSGHGIQPTHTQSIGAIRPRGRGGSRFLLGSQVVGVLWAAICRAGREP